MIPAPLQFLCFHPNRWNHRGYKILTLSNQVKQGKVHGILITPLQFHSKLHWKIPEFSLQCFHRNGWNHRGVNFFNPSTQFYYSLGWEGNWKKPWAVLYSEYNKQRISNFKSFSRILYWQYNISRNYIIIYIIMILSNKYLLKHTPRRRANPIPRQSS